VTIGHSQGGLLTKLIAVQGGERFWSNVSDVSIEELDLEPETQALLEPAFYFEPLPQLRRVIFICTPHGGSFLAGRRLGSFASSLVKIPVTLGRAGRDLFETDPEKRVLRKLDHMPSSIDNMTPGNPLLETLHDTPLDEAVTGHSIIAVRTEAPPMNQHDGVVAYSSAHIEGVVSEKIVISGHSAQGHPDTIAEVRRILLEHLDAR
jgi:triacylglycerol esterase/lipase EstA (alpha/beta hydrolase family)